MDSSNSRSEVTLNVRETIDDRGTALDQSRNQVSTGPSDGDQALKFWGFKWIPQVRRIDPVAPPTSPILTISARSHVQKPYSVLEKLSLARMCLVACLPAFPCF